MFARLILWMNGAGVLGVFLLTFLICADIIGRTAFDHPILGVTEIVSLSLVAFVFLQLPYAISRRRLMRVEMVVVPLAQQRPATARDWDVAVALIGAALFALIVIGEGPDFLRAWRTSEFAGVEGLFKVPVWPIKLVVVAGSLVAGVELVRQAIAAVAKPTPAPTAADAFSTKSDSISAAAVADNEAARAEPFSWRLAVPAGLLLAGGLVAALAFGAEPRLIGAAMIALTLVLIVLGMPIAFALFVTGFVGLALLKQDLTIATKTLALAAEGTISEYVFATVPLFVLMGLFVNVSEIGRDAFRAAQRIFGRIYGGLGVATVAANAVFAAITGISVAAAAIFSKIAVPEMVRQGYTMRFAVGLTAGSSLLGMLIPPSLLLIIYGVIAEVSIGGLFLAAIVPGLLLATAFAVGVILMAWLWPSFVGDVKPGSGEAGSWGSVLLGMVPVALLIVLVLGGIYGGIFTPTEAGAAGAAGAMVLTLLKRRLTLARLWEVIAETGQVSVAILFLIIAASTFSRMLTLTELPQDMAAFLGNTGLGLAGFLGAYLLLLIVLGAMLDSTSIMLIMLPLALPVAVALGANLIWFGVITTIAIEIGLLTPPFGLSVYVIKASLDDQRVSLSTIFGGALPFVLITLLVTIALMAFPQLSLGLL